MKIGISVHIRNPDIGVYYEHLLHAYHLAELFQSLHNDVYLITFQENCGNVLSQKILDTILNIVNNNRHIRVIDFTSLLDTIQNNTVDCLDLFIDINGYVSHDIRSQLSENSIAFITGSPLMEEYEHSININNYLKRHFNGVSAVWIWDEWSVNGEDKILQILCKKPVVRVPFVWSPTLCNNTSDKSTLHSDSNFVKNPLVLRSMESELSNTSTNIVPLSAIGHLYDKGEISICRNEMMSFKNLYENTYFCDNILPSILNNNKRQKPIWREFELPSTWELSERMLVIGHCRFTPIQLYMFDLLWMGIPFVHNSVLLKKIHACLEKTYYNGNNTFEIAQKIESFIPFTNNELEQIKYNLLQAYSISDVICKKWGDILNTYIVKERAVITASCEVNTSENDNIENDVKSVMNQARTSYTIAFAHFWQGFDATNNFFLNLLQHFYGNNYEFIGIDYEMLLKSCEFSQISDKIQLIFYGPFYEDTPLFPDMVPRVFFSGENTDNTREESLYPDLYLTFSTKEDNRHIRFPLWILFIDWFSENANIPHDINLHSDTNYRQQCNPNTLPLYLTTEPHSAPGFCKLAERPHFCSFIVSNPTCEIRNQLFHLLDTQYKHVHSGGAYCNNIGGTVQSQYAGGGAGDIAKYIFMRDHKFALCFENSIGDGYVTEKLLHAKMAGCIPLYYGDESCLVDFCRDGFVNLKTMFGDDVNAMYDYIVDLDNPLCNTECESIASCPAFTQDMVVKLWEKMEYVASRCLAFCQKKREVSNISLNNTRVASVIPSPIFVSFITANFKKSVEYNLNSMTNIRKYVPKLRYIIYYYDNVENDKNAIDELKLQFPWIELRAIPVSSLHFEQFPDFWTPTYYAWKLWILQEIAQNAEFKNALVVYTDAGAQWLTLADKLFHMGYTNDIACFYDIEQCNYQWCNLHLIKAVNASDDILQKNQILAGFIAFKAGSEKACGLFKQAYQLAQNRDVLCGDNIHTYIDTNGILRGNRYDQSILSLLFLQNNVQMLDAKQYMALSDARTAVIDNKPIYLHREKYYTHTSKLGTVDDIWMINLNRRYDRFQSFMSTYAQLSDFTHRFPAIDGKKLIMNEELYSIFPITDHKWKKSVMGCALSHMILWMQLACESEIIHNYLVLEDDMRFRTDINISLEKISQAMNYAPEDADILYLGGILPMNTPILDEVVSPVNEYWGKIMPNHYFTPPDKPPQPIIHLCAYSYIITKKGAVKLLNGLHKSGMGCYTSIDHYMWRPEFGMNNYILYPFITTCFQESDPTYVSSQFDNFDRIDTFDSDIWNNNDVFTESDIQPFSQIMNPPSWKSLLNFIKTSLKPEMGEICNATYRFISEENCVKAGLEDPDEFYERMCEGIIDSEDAPIVQNSIDDTITLSNPYTEPTICIYHLYNSTPHFPEISFIKHIYRNVHLQRYDLQSIQKECDTQNKIWLLITRQHIHEWILLMQTLDVRNIPFTVFHLDDTKLCDPIYFYSYNLCKTIIRTFVRDDIPNESKTKVHVIPIGPLSTLKFYDDMHKNLEQDLCTFTGRDVVWSFHGLSWFMRSNYLDHLSTFRANNVVIYNAWNEDTKILPDKYNAILKNTKFTPTPRGPYYDTHRIYEAIECGSIPLYVRNTGDEHFWKWITSHLSLLEIPSWSDAHNVIQFFLDNPEMAEKYRCGLISEWNKWIDELRAMLNGT
jgi:GR25 family glycosyltransferase involved in LPS biosynthesis